MKYSGVYVFGDSLVDAGNALKLAQWYGTLTASDLPDGAPTASAGYFQGRFTNGYTFADLLANKAIGTVTQPIFPYGYEDPWLGIPISPFSSDPSGNNLNFAYGGAQIERGDEVVPDLDGQTDAFRDAVDGRADPGALYVVTMGGNDVRSLVKSGSDPVPRDIALGVLDGCAQQLIHELSQLITTGVKNILITGIPDVGLVARYDVDGDNMLDPDIDLDGDGVIDVVSEAGRAAAATEYSEYLDALIRNEVIPALEARGAVVTYAPIMDHVTPSGQLVQGALNANLATLEALNGLQPGDLSDRLLQHDQVLFFDGLHPTAQAHALLGAYIHAQLNNAPWVENLPDLGADVDYVTTGSIGVAGEIDKVTIAMVAGTTYSFQMLGVSSLTPHVLKELGLNPAGIGVPLGDPSLKIVSPSGVVLRADDDSGAGFDADLIFDVTSAGTYTLQLTAVGSLTGSYVLTAAVSGAAMSAGNNYTVSSAATLVLEGAGGIGVDTVSASVSYALAKGSEIETLQTTNPKGKTAINLTGNEFGQKIIGNAAANVLEGKGGADEFTGGAGNDRFVLGMDAISNSAAIDSIKDYASGDVVDVTQVLKVASGTDVVTGGYLRVVTVDGVSRIQVDLDGGGNDWGTLSTINGTGSVAVRYTSGGNATTVSVARVTESQLAAASTSTRTMSLAGAVAAAGISAEPVAASTSPNVEHTDFSAMLINATAGDHFGQGPLGAQTFRLSPVESLDLGKSDGETIGMAGIHGRAVELRDWNEFDAGAPPAAPAALLGATDPAGAFSQIETSFTAQGIVFPPAEMLQAIASANPVDRGRSTAEVSRVLVDALEGGSGAADLHVLLNAVEGGDGGPASALAAANPPSDPLFAPLNAQAWFAELLIHHDAPATIA